MLPPFDEFGYLPPGIHSCSVDELVATFGSGSPKREVATQELVDFITWARVIGVQRVVVNGSYVTAKGSPNDVDIVILPSVEYTHGELALSEELFAWPFLHILIAADDVELEEWSMQHFGADRNLMVKGVVEVLI